MRSNVRYLPGVVPAATPGPPRVVDRDAVAERYTALLEARADSPTSVINHLAGACADDVPALEHEIDRVETLRAELATAVNELAAVIAAVRALHYETTADTADGPVLVCAECGTEVDGGPCPTIAALDGGAPNADH